MASLSVLPFILLMASLTWVSFSKSTLSPFFILIMNDFSSVLGIRGTASGFVFAGGLCLPGVVGLAVSCSAPFFCGVDVASYVFALLSLVLFAS